MVLTAALMPGFWHHQQAASYVDLTDGVVSASMPNQRHLIQGLGISKHTLSLLPTSRVRGSLDSLVAIVSGSLPRSTSQLNDSPPHRLPR